MHPQVNISKHSGLSLIELLVSMTIGLLFVLSKTHSWVLLRLIVLKTRFSVRNLSIFHPWEG